jgi:hypothetical protein
MFVVPSFFGFQYAGKPDPDYLAFYARVVAAGGSLTTTEQSATNQLVVNLKGYSLWTKMKAIYPMVGGGTGTTAARQAACSQNLVSSSFTGAYSSGWTFASTGVTPNGTSAFMDTSLVPSLVDSLNFAMGVYMRTNTGAGSPFAMHLGSTNGTVTYQLAPRWTGFGNVTNLTIGQGANEINSAPGPNGTGFYQGSRTSSTAISSRKNNTSLGNNTVLTLANNTTFPMFIGARNSSGSASFFNNDENNFVYFSSGLTNLEMDNFYTAVQAFNTTLSRQV